MAVRADGDPAAAVIDAAPGLRVDEIVCDVLVVGGGTGGVACALAATRTLPASGRVALLEETDWITVAGEVNGAPDSLEYAAVGRRLT